MRQSSDTTPPTAGSAATTATVQKPKITTRPDLYRGQETIHPEAVGVKQSSSYAKGPPGGRVRQVDGTIITDDGREIHYHAPDPSREDMPGNGAPGYDRNALTPHENPDTEEARAASAREARDVRRDQGNPNNTSFASLEILHAQVAPQGLTTIAAREMAVQAQAQAPAMDDGEATRASNQYGGSVSRTTTNVADDLSTMIMKSSLTYDTKGEPVSQRGEVTFRRGEPQG